MKKFQQVIIGENGARLYLPPDPDIIKTEMPLIFEESIVKQYPLGTRYVDGQNTFHYYKAGGTIAYILAGIFSNVALHAASGVHTYGAALAGATTLKIDGTSAGVPVADAWAGGQMLIIGGAAGERTNVRIVSNLAAESTTPYAVEITLEQPLPFDVSNDTDVEIIPNRYASAVTAWGGALLGTYYTCLGLPTRKMTANYYGWVKTWGPAFAARAAYDTSSDGNRTMVWSTDGSIRPCSLGVWDETSVSWQLAGYSLSIGGTGDGWFFMMMDP